MVKKVMERDVWLHKLAMEKGIKEYEMYLDYSSPKYEMLYREYKC